MTVGSGPRFLLQIVDAETGVVARFPAGKRGQLERPLIDACTAAIVANGVGYFKSEAQVRKAITDGLTQVFTELKSDSRYLV